ncbi:MAG: molybdopterin adenylyltransferase [Clostridia bacterium]|nr:molybdopterin adenylyltransferase [Clostridia bacterium]
MRISILTVSDRCSRGEKEDKSGPLIKEIFGKTAEILCLKTVPDEKEEIKKALIEMSDFLHSDVVFTTGGTGFAPRDVTPEATKEVIEKEVPGIPEAVRAESLKITPRAVLSRAAAGIRGKTLIINLPGSPKAVKESLDVITPALPHAVETLSGATLSCGRE